MFGIGILTTRIARLERTVRRQQDTIDELCRRAGIEPPAPDPAQTLDDTERDLIDQGKKIQAMAHHRRRTGSGLQEAKEIVERG